MYFKYDLIKNSIIILLYNILETSWVRWFLFWGEFIIAILFKYRDDITVLLLTLYIDIWNKGGNYFLTNSMEILKFLHHCRYL